MKISVLRSVLIEKKITIQELAEKISMSRVGLTEAFTRGDLKVSVLEKICIALDINPCILLDLNKEHTGSLTVNENESIYETSPSRMKILNLQNENEMLKKEITYLKEINLILRERIADLKQT